MPTAGSSNMCSLLTHKLAFSQPPLRCQCSPPSRFTPYVLACCSISHSLTTAGAFLPRCLYTALAARVPPYDSLRRGYTELPWSTLGPALYWPFWLTQSLPVISAFSPGNISPWDILPCHSGYSKAGFPL